MNSKRKIELILQFFGESVANAMELYKNLGVTEFYDAEPTIKFIRLVNNLIKSMNSRTAEDALKPQDDCKIKKVLFF